MPTVITHAVTGLAAGKFVTARKMPVRFWVLSAICPLMPDIDGIGYMMGIPYAHYFGHRGFFHSPFFALLLGLIVTGIFFSKDNAFSKRFWLLALYFFIITATHGILDAMTDGGLGIAFLSPFSNGRFFMPWRPLVVAPISILAFFSDWGAEVIISEIIWIWIPTFFAFALSVIIRKILLSRQEHTHSRTQTKNRQS